MRGPRLQVGSASWIAEERASALHISQSEVEEFSFSARNELDWLNEHMAGIFNENETYRAPCPHSGGAVADSLQEHRRNFQDSR